MIFINNFIVNIKIAQKMPRTRLYCGTLDPCFDSNLRYLERLTQNNVDCYLHEYVHLPHGLFNMALANFAPAKFFFSAVNTDIWSALNCED